MKSGRLGPPPHGQMFPGMNWPYTKDARLISCPRCEKQNLKEDEYFLGGNGSDFEVIHIGCPKTFGTMMVLPRKTDKQLEQEKKAKQRGLAKRIYTRLMAKGLIVYEPGSAEAAKKVIIEEVSRGSIEL